MMIIRTAEKVVPIVNSIRPLLNEGAMKTGVRLINEDTEENKNENISGYLDASGSK